MIHKLNSDMSKNETNKTKWSSDCSTYPDIEPHTKEKHYILKSYLKDWIVTLCANHPRNTSTLTIIDGFCGGGFYRDVDFKNSRGAGSPPRILDTIEEALTEIREKRSKPNFQLDIKVFFVDSNYEHTECLKKYLKFDLSKQYKNFNYEVINEEFSIFLNRSLPELKKRKGSTFFCIDPFGYTQYSMDDIRAIMNLGKSEILLTFMIENFKRFLKNRDTQYETFNRKLEANRYFAYKDFEKFEPIYQQAYLREELLRLFRDKGNVKYLYTFGMLHNSTSVKYYLVHFANHLRAQEVIKDTLWRYNNINFAYQFSYGVYGLAFRTPEYYEKNLKLFDIKNENENKCITDLEQGILPLIYRLKDGLSFHDLVDSTIQKNPANIHMYSQFLIKARDEKEIRIKRDGKYTKANTFRSSDIIVKSNDKELFLFDMSKYYQDK